MICFLVYETKSTLEKSKVMVFTAGKSTEIVGGETRHFWGRKFPQEMSR